MAHKKGRKPKAKRAARKTSARPRQPVKDNPAKAWPLPKLVEHNEMADTSSLIVTPYQLFAPVWEMFALPWRSFLPFTPWPR